MPVPNDTKERYLEGAIDLATDTLRVALFDDSTAYSFDADAHEFVSDILDGGTTAQEVSGTGYSRKTLSGVTVTEDTTDDEAVFDADDVTWSGFDAGTIQGIIVYVQVGGDDSTPGDDPVVLVLDDSDLSGLPATPGGNDFKITWSSEGVLNLA